MSELLISLLRFGFLLALWLLVLAVLGVLRSDVFGTRVVQRGGAPAAAPTWRDRIGARVGGRTRSGTGRRAGAGTAPAAGAGAGAAVGAAVSGSPRAQSQDPRGAGRASSRTPRRTPVKGHTGPSRLVVVDGPLAGTTLPLSSASILAGRAPSSTLVLDDDFASSRHARFFPQGATWYVEDLGSTNGTTVGGRRISGTPVEVPVGTPVQIGRTTVELRR